MACPPEASVCQTLFHIKSCSLKYIDIFHLILPLDAHNGSVVLHLHNTNEPTNMLIAITCALYVTQGQHLCNISAHIIILIENNESTNNYDRYATEPFMVKHFISHHINYRDNNLLCTYRHLLQESSGKLQYNKYGPR